MPATVAANASNDVQGISCAICCEKKKPRRLHMLCGVCESSDKKSCLECWAKLLHNCDELNCVALHLKCPWCRTPMQQSELNASALSGSNAFNRVAAKLRYEHLCNLLHEREDNLDMLNHAVDAISGQSNLQSMSAQQQHTRLQRARSRLQNADSFLNAYDGFTRFRRRYPRPSDRRNIARVAADFQRIAFEQVDASVDGDES